MGRAPVSPCSRAEGGRGDSAPSGTPSQVSRRVGGRARRQRWGRGAEGAQRKGEGLLAVPRPGALPVLVPGPAVLPQSSVSPASQPPPPPTKIKPETSRRGWLSPLKRPLCGRRRAPSVEGLGIGGRGRGGEGGVALASARFPPSCPRPVMSARDPAGNSQSSGEVDSKATDARNSNGKV